MVGALSDDARLTSVWRLFDVCLSVAYIGPKSRTERPRKTKIGTEVAHVTHDSDTNFKVKKSKINLQGRGILWRPPAQLVRCVKSTSVQPVQYSKNSKIVKSVDKIKCT